MPPVGFEPMISAGERAQTYALDRAATGTGYGIYTVYNFVTTRRDGLCQIYSVHNSSLLVLIPSHLNPIHAIPSYACI